MKSKKMTKKELKEAIEILINTVICDRDCSENTFLSNEVYSSYSDEFLSLDESGRALLSEKITNENHIIKRLMQLIDKL